MEKEKEKFIETSIDNIVVELSKSLVKLDILTDIVLTVCKEYLPTDVYIEIYSAFVDRLEKQLIDVLDHSRDVLFDSGSFLLKKKTDIAVMIQSMKSSDFYRKNG